MDMKLEIVFLPVSDVDRAKAFYEKLGWRLDIDYAPNEKFRVIQFTPPHSEASIIFGKGITSAESSSADSFVLAVDNVDAARDDLIARGDERERGLPLRWGPVQQHCGELACRRPRSAGSFLFSRLPRSTIQRGTAGYFRRSRRDFPVVNGN